MRRNRIFALVASAVITIAGMSAWAQDGDEGSEGSADEGTSILTGLSDPDKIFGGATAGADGTSEQWYQLDRQARKALRDGLRAQAESLWKQAVAKAEATGRIDPGVVTCLVGLSYVNHLNGNFGESERLYEYAMRDVEGTTGRESSQFIQYIPDLAWLYNSHGKPDKAEVLLKHALVVNERAHGAQSPQCAQCLEQYAEFLKKSNRTTEARQHEQRARAIRGRVSQQKNEQSDLDRESGPQSSSSMEISDDGIEPNSSATSETEPANTDSANTEPASTEPANTDTSEPKQ